MGVAGSTKPCLVQVRDWYSSTGLGHARLNTVAMEIQATAIIPVTTQIVASFLFLS